MSDNGLAGLKKHLWSIVGLLLLQTFAAVWWASNLTTRMGRVERDVDQVSTRVHNLETTQ